MLSLPVKDKDLLEAIRLKCANCYAAMSFANQLGGTLTDAWRLCHTHPLKELLDEATERKLDLSGLKAAVDGTPVTESLYYKRAAGLMTEEEFQAAFHKWRKGE